MISVSSLHLEEFIARVPGVAEVAAIGIPDEVWGERPLVLIVPTEEFRNRLTSAQIMEYLEQLSAEGVITRYAVPRRVEFVDALEKTSVGKIDKKLLRQRYAR